MAIGYAACAISGLGLILLGMSGPFYRIGLFPLPWSFQLLRWAAYLGIAGIVAASIAGLLAYRGAARKPRLLAGLAFVMGLIAFAIPFQW